MNLFKALMFLILATPVLAFAENVRCKNPDMKFTCSTKYNFKNWSSINGPSNTGAMEDLQPEPFDPAACVASSVLYTSEGKIIANLTEEDMSIHAWLEYNGKTRLIIDNSQLDKGQLTTTISTQLKGDIESISLVCHTSK